MSTRRCQYLARYGRNPSSGPVRFPGEFLFTWVAGPCDREASRSRFGRIVTVAFCGHLTVATCDRFGACLAGEDSRGVLQPDGGQGLTRFRGEAACLARGLYKLVRDCPTFSVRTFPRAFATTASERQAPI